MVADPNNFVVRFLQWWVNHEPMSAFFFGNLEHELRPYLSLYICFVLCEDARGEYRYSTLSQNSEPKPVHEEMFVCCAQAGAACAQNPVRHIVRSVT